MPPVNVTLRAGKPAGLTNAQIDGNMTALKEGVEKSASLDGATFTGRVAVTTDVLVDAATTVLDATTGNFFAWTIGGNRALSIVNAVPGQFYTLEIKQDTTGNRVVTWPAGFTWPAGTPGVLSTGANAVDVLSFVVLTTGAFRAVLTKGFA